MADTKADRILEEITWLREHLSTSLTTDPQAMTGLTTQLAALETAVREQTTEQANQRESINQFRERLTVLVDQVQALKSTPSSALSTSDTELPPEEMVTVEPEDAVADHLEAQTDQEPLQPMEPLKPSHPKKYRRI